MVKLHPLYRSWWPRIGRAFSARNSTLIRWRGNGLDVTVLGSPPPGLWTARSDRQLFSPASGWRTDKWFHITCHRSFLINLPLGRVLLDTHSIYLQLFCSSMFSTVSLSTPLHQQQTRYLFNHSSTCSSPSTLSSSGSALENIIVCLWLP